MMIIGNKSIIFNTPHFFFFLGTNSRNNGKHKQKVKLFLTDFLFFCLFFFFLRLNIFIKQTALTNTVHLAGTENRQLKI